MTFRQGFIFFFSNFRSLQLAVALTALLSQHTNGQILSLGKCPEVAVQPDFNADSYLGLWYEQEKYPFIFEFGGRCVTAEYGKNSDGTVSVFNRQQNVFTLAENTIRGSARIVEPAKLAVKFSIPFEVESPYWVLGTDYKSFAVVYSCNEIGGLFNTKVVWILTRDRTPPVDVMNQAYTVLDTAKLT
ncbi:apolipoprotein D-like, partial [Uranotaenia lowii]|uniref:apolipoprotein D-like n=1 Tax=Uranotaenia lowii TaxID=190385 RepID=UPI00247A203E